MPQTQPLPVLMPETEPKVAAKPVPVPVSRSAAGWNPYQVWRERVLQGRQTGYKPGRGNK